MGASDSYWKLLGDKLTQTKALAVAQEFLDEGKDVPASFVYELAARGLDPEALATKVYSLRKAHFKKLGKPVPKYDKPVE